ncbi:MAG: hypothetical protein KDB57_05405 [Solirubrobacterales bacterium]|nr:hypothetical protein [Solirubrobacterales bacterium]
MFYSWLPMLLIVAGSLVIGRAITRACGQKKWWGIEPAVGFAALMAVEGLLARIPGTRTALIIGLVALAAASIWVLRRPRREDLPGSPLFWVAGLIAALLLSTPFLISGQWGLLGMGYNNDLGLHLAWTEWLRSGFGTEPSDGYPLGPHGLTAALTAIPGFEIGKVFIGQVGAIAVLAVMTGWAAVEPLGRWRRLLAALLIGLPYLMVSYYAQAAFKELAAAMFLLAFVIALPRLTPLPAEKRLRAVAPLLILLLGIIFTYSFPGLAWPAAALAAWLLADPAFRERFRSGALWGWLKKPIVAISAIVFLGLLAVLAFLGPFGFGDAFSEVATSDAFGPVSALEGLGIWLTSDYRLAGRLDTPVPALLGAISVLALLVSLWWWRKQPRSPYPLAFLACAFLYLISLPWVGDYSLAKALVIAAPVTMVVILTALLSGPKGGWKPSQGMEFGAWVTLTALFVIGATASSLLVLRDASVAPPGHSVELGAFKKEVDGKRVLFADQDRFAPYYLTGAKVSVPLAEFPDPDVIENPKKPFQGDTGQGVIDFDSFEGESLGNFDYVITSAAAFQSDAPPFFEEVDRTNSYVLWKRVDEAVNRPVLNELTLPARLADCSEGGGLYFSTEVEGTATVLPPTVLALRDEWLPSPDLEAGDSATMTLNLTQGFWWLSMQYFTPRGFTLTTDTGFKRVFKPAIDGQRLANMETGSNGQYWPAGVLDIRKAGPVTITVKAKDPTRLQDLTGYSRMTKLGRVAAMKGQGRRKVEMSQICDQWVDYFRRVPISVFRQNDTKRKAAKRDRSIREARRFNRVQGEGVVEAD